MKPSLKAGLTHSFAYRVPDSNTVPYLFPDQPDFQSMPGVLATPYMIGLMEWTCMRLVKPYLDEGEGSVGVHVNVSHEAPTPPGLNVIIDAECTAVEDKLITFRVNARDGIDMIGRGTHQRFVVRWDAFNARLADKLKTPVTGIET